jgi:hypothetical protein
MPIRYRLLPFSKNDISTPAEVKAFAERLGEFGYSPLADLSLTQWESALSHALAAEAQSILLQYAVRDPDFLEEYEAFYSKQQKHISRLCRRLHFFSLPFLAAGHASHDPTGNPITFIDDVGPVLDFIDHAAAADKSYLGFVTLRPLRHAPVGASILVDLPQLPATCKDSFPVHIAGRDFSVIGTPYLQQDNAVGACAQASIWVALRTLRRRVGNSAFSPAELTVAATKHFTASRVFPGRKGLTTFQMLEAIRSAGHDPLITELDSKKPTTPDEAIQFAAPYLESGLPVILALDNIDAGGGHAVVAIGHSGATAGSPNPTHLTIHNDNTGCYLSLPKQPATKGAYALSQCFALITPLPDGICMTAAEAEKLANATYQFGRALLNNLPTISAQASTAVGLGAAPNLILRIFLSTRHSFRRWATESSDIDLPTKLKYRSFELPKYVWVTEVHDAGSFQLGNYATPTRLGEFVFDASADPLHGDSLIFMRLSGLIFGSAAPDDGLLLVEDVSNGSSKKLLAIKAPPSFPQTEPWR